MNDDDLALAFELTADAIAISLSWYDAGVPVTTKPDGSPVSEADLEVDRVLCEILAEERPEDGVLSEESPERHSSNGRRWIIDPIDGTSSFIRAGTGWGNHIALEVDGQIVLGIMTRPVADQIFWAVNGMGAFISPIAAPDDRSTSVTITLEEPALVSGIGVSEAAQVAVTAVAQWTPRRGDVLADFFTGELSGIWLQGGKIWDYAPLALMCTEAGASFRTGANTTELTTERFLAARQPLLDRLSEHLFA